MHDIVSGELPVGTRLPGELELRETFEVSRYTVREALRVLEELGVIERRQGIGTVVKSRHGSQSYVHAIQSLSELLQYPGDTRLKIQQREAVTVNRKLARVLGCRTGTRWMKLSGVRRLIESGMPVCWIDIYVLPEYASVASLIGRQQRPVYELIERRFGEQVVDVRLDLFAQSVDAAMAEPLNVEPESPALSVVRRYLGNQRRPFEVSVAVHPADRFTYSVRLQRGWQPC